MQIQDESKRNQARVTLKPGGAVLASLCALCLWAIAQAADTFVLVKEKSRIEFVGSKPGGWHRGGFKQFSVDGSADWSDLSRSSVRIEIDATSLWSDEGGLTRHLQAADFFDVSRYPKIEFETTQISLTTPQDAVVTGKLTMLGKSVEVALPCRIEVTDAGLTVKSEFTIDRTQWGMTHGRGRVNDEVDITARLVLGH